MNVVAVVDHLFFPLEQTHSSQGTVLSLCKPYNRAPVYSVISCKAHRLGACVFNCNLPPALLAKWPESFSFMCYWRNTKVEGNQNKSSQEADPVEENSPTIPARIGIHNLMITNLTLTTELSPFPGCQSTLMVTIPLRLSVREMFKVKTQNPRYCFQMPCWMWFSVYKSTFVSDRLTLHNGYLQALCSCSSSDMRTHHSCPTSKKVGILSHQSHYDYLKWS